MTSPATSTGAVARGAAPLLDYHCASCDRRFSGDASFVRWASHTLPGAAAYCAGVVVLDVIRDDRAGVTLPIAIQPVGRDQLDPGGAGQVEGEGDAGGAAGAQLVDEERSRP